MLARPPAADPRVKSLCSEFDIEIIPANVYPLPGQTRAPATIRRLIDKHGAEHARLVLCILAEGKGNDALIDETSLSAISDLLLACPDVVEGSTSDLLDLFDTVPLGPYMAIANELRGVVHQGHALAGMLYLHVRRLREGSLAAKEASRGKVDHANASEIEKGRAAFRKGAHRTVKEKTEIGRQLLAKKAALPRGHFGPWLQESGLSSHMAHQCMALARSRLAAC
ncbi:MAG TPA: hypothetical protein VGX71_27595 [Pseudaminobacter sp.]|nr:hypothetical protein [Pseudaminobacter sp.]